MRTKIVLQRVATAVAMVALCAGPRSAQADTVSVAADASFNLGQPSLANGVGPAGPQGNPDPAGPEGPADPPDDPGTPAASFVSTVIVSPVVGDPLASGTVLRNAYAAVVRASPEAPILLKLEPGSYDVGGTPFALSKPGVHLEGSGRDVTTILGSGWVVMQFNVNRNDVTINLSRLSVQNNGGDGLTVYGGRLNLGEVRVTTNAARPEGAAARCLASSGSEAGRARGCAPPTRRRAEGRPATRRGAA